MVELLKTAPPAEIGQMFFQSPANFENQRAKTPCKGQNKNGENGIDGRIVCVHNRNNRKD